MAAAEGVFIRMEGCNSTEQRRVALLLYLQYSPSSLSNVQLLTGLGRLTLGANFFIPELPEMINIILFLKSNAQHTHHDL